MCLCDLCLVACTVVKTHWTSSISSVHVQPMYRSDECLINYITLQSYCWHFGVFITHLMPQMP